MILVAAIINIFIGTIKLALSNTFAKKIALVAPKYLNRG